MKKTHLYTRLLMLFVMLGIGSSCEKDESFAQVTGFERDIHNAINEHRVSIEKTEMVLQFLMVDDAQLYSTKMANGTINGVEQIITDFRTLQTNLGGDASSVWIAECQYENVDSVMHIVLNNAEIKTTIEGNYNQSAVGAVKDSNGIYHITHLLMHIP